MSFLGLWLKPQRPRRVVHYYYHLFFLSFFPGRALSASTGRAGASHVLSFVGRKDNTGGPGFGSLGIDLAGAADQEGLGQSHGPAILQRLCQALQGAEPGASKKRVAMGTEGAEALG